MISARFCSNLESSEEITDFFGDCAETIFIFLRCPLNCSLANFLSYTLFEAKERL